MDDVQKIRKFETEILDKWHENFAFYQYSEDIVIPYLLQVYGDIERYRENLIGAGHDETAMSFYLNNMLHGVGHCVRWIMTQKTPKVLDTSSTTVLEIHDMAADFLGWGTGYHMIAQEFIAWSRKIKSAILDEANKHITFMNPEGYDYSTIYDKQILYRERMQAEFLSYPHDEMETEFAEWIKDIDFTKPPIANHLNWERGKSSKSYLLLYTKMSAIIFPELSEKTDFAGYNLQNLRTFYALFFLNFYFIRWVESVLDSQSGKNLSFGSNPLYLSDIQFERLASRMTGLSINVSKAIISDLTFNPNNLHTSISIQPFIRSSTGTYFILPNLFSQLEPSRMILGALNKGSKKKEYDRLINIIEKANLTAVHDLVGKISRCSIYLERVLKFEGRQIHPDLILIDINGKNLLVVDYKHFIGPITASEVDYKMNELSKANRQVQNYIELIGKMSKIGAHDVKGFSIYGLIITHKPLPVPIPVNNFIPILDLGTFTTIAKSVIDQGHDLDELIALVKNNKNANPKNIFTAFESEIQVGEWKVKRSQFKITKIDKD